MPRALAGRALAAIACVLLLASCNAAVYVANRGAAVAGAELAGIDAQDRDDLAAGRLEAVRARYANRPYSEMTATQTALYCDVLLKFGDFGRASGCLDAVEVRLRGDRQALTGSAAERLAGKRALLALAAGRADVAKQLTDGDQTDGGRYVNALASIRLGNTAAARATANSFAVTFKPLTVYFAASLFAGINDFARARAVLEDPERRLLRDYGLSPGSDIFGNTVGTAPFRLDVFDEFGFGLVSSVNFSPAANVYVEYLAAHVYLRQGVRPEAQRRLDAVLNFPSIEAFRDILWRALYDRAELAQQAGDTDGAIALLRRAVDAIEAIRSSLASESGRIAVLSDKEAPYARLVDLLTRQGSTTEALAYAERAHGRALVDLLASRKDFGADDPGRKQLNSDLELLDRAAGDVQVTAATVPAETRERLAAVAAARHRLQQDAPAAADLVTVQPIDIPTVQRQLAANEAALVFFQGETTWHVFAIRSDRVVAHQVSEGDVTQAAIAFRASLLNQASTDYLAAGQALYAKLLAPVLDGLNVSSLVVVPYGPLYYVPFAAIHDGHQFLVDRFTLRVLPTLGLLGRNAARTTPPGALVIGNPQQGDPEYSLHFAEAEAKEVAAMVPDATLVIGANATIPTFEQLARDRGLIHYAGHGLYDSSHPLESGLALTSPTQKLAMLTTRRLYDMSIGASLVFLSACQTGLGKVEPGQDLVGLERGFFFAGADSVIASLWSVDDRATERLVHEFYVAWLRHETPAAALRAAQIKAREAFPHPYFWAPFVVATAGHG